MSSLEARSDTRWWGWGDPKVETALDHRVRELLASRGIPIDDPVGPPPMADVEIPEARSLPGELLETAGSDAFFTDHETRLRHANGHSLADLLARRSGRLESAPDAVVIPRDTGHAAALLEVAARTGVAVIPFGGGTSVTGGLNPDPDRLTISLDTVGFDSVEVDPESRTAWLGAGLRGPEAEDLLNEAGFTLGHFPQSFEYATIGGFAATRSAGQASSGFGRFDEMVLGIRIVTPAGVFETPAVRHASEGPSLLEAALGSEGVLGVITAVEVRIAPVPPTGYEAWILPDFASGVQAARRMAQAGDLPSILRLSDRTETSLNLALSGPGGIAGRIFRSYLGIRGRGDGSLLLLGFEEEFERARVRRQAVRKEIRRSGGITLGASPGRAWSHSRFHGPYLREGLLDLGLVVETFETAAPWADYLEAHRALSEVTTGALEAEGMKGEVLCHLSHAYRDAASLYFTVVASPGPRGSLASWQAVKRTALEEIGRLGLPVSHHHGVGRDHVSAFEERVGEPGIQALRGLKQALDPAGIMNPGCLLPESDPRTP